MYKSIINSGDFNLNSVLLAKPFYFFYNNEPKKRIFENNKEQILNFSQEKNKLIVTSEKKISEKTLERVKFCFGINEDLSSFYKICQKDKVLSNFTEKIKNIKILSAFSDFEAVIGCIVSQNISFGQYIKKMNLMEDFGFFPENFLKNDLSKFKLGYKEKYIKNVSEFFLKKEISNKEELKDIKGIGEYSINLYTIFQKRDYSCFYWDCLIEKIFLENYALKLSKKQGIEKANELWGDFRGLSEVFLQKLLNDI